MNPAYLIAGLIVLFPLLRLWEQSGEPDEDAPDDGPVSVSQRIVAIVIYLAAGAVMMAIEFVPIGI